MEVARQQSFRSKKIVKQLTGKRDDSPLHSAARSGNLGLALDIIAANGAEELRELLSKQNQAGETALYVAAEYGYVDLVKEMLPHYDVGCAVIKARNGYDAFHIAAKQGDVEMLMILLEAIPQLSVTFDQSNSTSLYTAAAQGHVEVVNFLLERNSDLATITRNNGKTALHASARNGHSDVVKSLLNKESRIVDWNDKKGQTALHMAVKGHSIEVVDVLISLNSALATMVDTKGNTALHVAVRKGRPQIVEVLLKHMASGANTINKSGDTAFDIAEKNGYSDIAIVLQGYGVLSAKFLGPLPPARELKQTVSDIKHDVHNQLQHTRQTRKRVRVIAKRVNKMHEEGLSNAINSTTIVSVLIATVAFAAIFNLPAQYADDPKNVAPGFSLGEANIAQKPQFKIFFISDSLALFISLAVVVVQTSVVVVERKAKKQLMAIINKLMWLACVFVSIAFLAMCYIVVGDKAKWLSIGTTVLGSLIMVTTLGTLCYLVISHRIEAANLRSLHRSARSSKSMSGYLSVKSDSEILDNEHKKLYAI